MVNFPIVDGNSREKARIVYSGKTTIKADNNIKYRCLELSYEEVKKGSWKTIATFFVSDDANHIPIRIDMHLKFGAAKAFLISIKGNKSPITSQVK